ncbi:sugar-phosphatase [Granulicella rosea]|uniref:Sugar-phosphatase n=1 Tax=Granulicella rosea TaxID=474952 RepID=A0A239KKP4_9BACT|nr:HAD-IA family hydrolase [Granulicella rosea]SNT18262.1 sugar-phosphatase [Granulicella rosea]
MNVSAKGLLFDNDGVIISSIASVNRCWKLWTKHYGIEGWESYVIPHGVRATDIMKSLRSDFGPEQLAEGLRRIEDLEIADVADLQVLPGVRVLLKSLPPERWTIVTSATRRLLVGRLKAADLPLPPRVIVGDEVVNGKPHPEPYIKGAAILGFAPADCIVIEDAPSGVGAGVASGARVLGVLGTHEAHELYAAGASWVVQSLEMVTATLVGDELSLTLAAVL